MAFADTLGAVGTLLNVGQGKRTTTTDSSTKFIASARVGTAITGDRWRRIAAARRWAGRHRCAAPMGVAAPS